MTEKTVFCEECRNDVNYTVAAVSMTGTVKGTEYSFTGKEARCTDCGNLVYVPKINDYNLRVLYNEHRAANGIISLEHILEIPKKYAIGKRPLSILLGWGEQTFSRYCEGDMPTRQYSEILTMVYNDPKYYSELLESGKGSLKSISAYEKSKKAVDELLGITSDKANEKKILLAVRYLLDQCEDITPLALQKALYYIQGFYNAFYNEFIFSENCEAWTHGPVYRDIYFRYRDYHFDPIQSHEKFDSSTLTAQEKAIFDNVIKYFCCYSGKVLERFTHNETPWLSARGNLPVYAPSEQIITHKSIREYFSAVKAKYNMVTPNDIRLYAQEMFLCI